MGNHPLISEILLVGLKELMTQRGMTSPVWIRYSDDVLFIMEESQLSKILTKINPLCKSITFAMETEQMEISFLEIKTIKKG